MYTFIGFRYAYYNKFLSYVQVFQEKKSRISKEKRDIIVISRYPQ